ncbi:coenzyme PQQ biosynthesis protein B [Rhodomicrobium vannielii ATCC 17100]|uniref:Coenzyme PQQ synthesis protein B n=1 Tax=Rhodomicrobium vannielii (strain ATCC 17100 / DSM 162 / LMG 4299 / NCIMB 10020 / ATH 3.1.1) TaxID=648757 RepID=E3I413_RHOVT|nr:pyrroloquinoline quinone biosynthesis protein PqqB [Rhodomicrobium vannielii]ADP72662.1 coenzyme PQQ biosynthesis protein B [Rhodomicrobium vannielii ATCC 17100]
MFVKVLGSAAGGGFPQWNCNARVSRLAWDDPALRRTQSSLAVSPDGERFVIVNTSPDLRTQILDNRELWPRRRGSARNSPIEALFLTNADVDAIAGLLTLRERQRLRLYASEAVLATIGDDRIFDVLALDLVERIAVVPGEKVTPLDGLTFEPFAVPGKIPLYREQPDEVPETGVMSGETIGLRISDREGGTLFYIPGCASINKDLLDRVDGAACLFFDGTVYNDGELRDADVGEKTGRRMGHVPIMGPGGSLNAFAPAKIQRKIYIHINTTNPILDPNSAAAMTVREAGWEIAADGMSFTL